jgi:hypothetical protein
MPNLIHLGLCVGLALPSVPAHWMPPKSGRVVLPVVMRTAERANHSLGACIIDVSAADSGVTMRVRTSSASGPDLEHDQDFAVPAAALPLSPGYAVRHEGMGLSDALTYDGADLRFEVRATEKPRHTTVYEIAVDAGLETVRGVKITEYDDAAPDAPLRSVLECESALN